jgi:hypothetical protein
MDNPLLIIGLVVVVVALVWVIRQGPPDDGIGPPPAGDDSWKAGG